MPNSDGPLQGTRNKLANDPRDRGTSPPQRAIQEFEDGEMVHLRIDPSVPDGRFDPKFNGKTGEVTGTQGDCFTVAVDDSGKEKTIIASAAHLTRQQE